MPKTLQEWLLAFGVDAAAAEISSRITEFCERVAGKAWLEFENAFLAYLEAQFPTGSPTTDLNRVLDDFFRGKPGVLLRGCEIERDFNALCRAVRDIDLIYLNEDAWAATGLTLGEMADLDDRTFAEKLAGWPPDQLLLSGRRSIVWCFDQDELSKKMAPLPASFERTAEIARKLIRIIGLVDLEGVRRMILLGYTKDNVGDEEPKTPTPIDGLGHSLYQAVQPCLHEGGRTRAAPGLPQIREGVHSPIDLTSDDSATGSTAVCRIADALLTMRMGFRCNLT